MAHNCELLAKTSGLLWGKVACHFGLLGFPGGQLLAVLVSLYSKYSRVYACAPMVSDRMRPCSGKLRAGTLMFGDLAAFLLLMLGYFRVWCPVTLGYLAFQAF